MGEALEEISRVTASVAHLYKNMEIGQEPGQFNLNINSYDEAFRPIIE